jgi:hypothetical protein
MYVFFPFLTPAMAEIDAEAFPSCQANSLLGESGLSGELIQFTSFLCTLFLETVLPSLGERCLQQHVNSRFEDYR